MKGGAWYAVIVLVIIVAVVLGITFGTSHTDTMLGAMTKLRMQKSVYKRAKKRAEEVQKPLLVIGNPRGGWLNALFPAYGCGDMCLDINGCECKANENPVHIKADLLTQLKSMPSNSCVSFESEVLCYVDNIADVIRELKRVTGDDMFAVHLLGTRCGFPKGMDIKASDTLRMPHRQIITHYPPFHPDYMWTSTPQFASHLYFSRKNLASEFPDRTEK